MLVDGVSKDGNLLLNVGPDGRGEFEPRAVDTLGAIGAWMDLHARSIRGAGPAPYVPPPDARYTWRGDRLYLHLFAWRFQHVHLPGWPAGSVSRSSCTTGPRFRAVSSTPPGRRRTPPWEGSAPTC